MQKGEKFISAGPVLQAAPLYMKAWIPGNRNHVPFHNFM